MGDRLKKNKGLLLCIVIALFFWAGLRYFFVETRIGFGVHHALFSDTFPTLMKPKAALKKWGDTPFDPLKFKGGSREVRASMAYSILVQQPFMGQTCKEVKKALGEPIGGSYWLGELGVKYVIYENVDYSMPGPPRGEAWEVVFYWTDRKGCQIEKVVVHKMCCLKAL